MSVATGLTGENHISTVRAEQRRGRLIPALILVNGNVFMTRNMGTPC